MLGSAAIRVETFPVLTVLEGDNAVFECKATELDGMTIPPCTNSTDTKWFVKESLVASCTADKSSNHDERRVWFDLQTGGLTIRKVSMSDTETYSCEVSSPEDIQTNKTKLIVQKSEYTILVFMGE